MPTHLFSLGRGGVPAKESSRCPAVKAAKLRFFSGVFPLADATRRRDNELNQEADLVSRLPNRPPLSADDGLRESLVYGLAVAGVEDSFR